LTNTEYLFTFASELVLIEASPQDTCKYNDRLCHNDRRTDEHRLEYFDATNTKLQRLKEQSPQLYSPHQN